MYIFSEIELIFSSAELSLSGRQIISLRSTNYIYFGNDVAHEAHPLYA